MGRRVGPALGAVLATMALVSPVLAEPGDHDRAVAAFEEARHFIDAGDCLGGVVRLEESLRYEPSVGANLSMADCYEVHDPLVAWRHLREAERISYISHDDRLAIARQRAAALESKLPLVHVQVAQTDVVREGFELRVDDTPVDPYFLTNGTFAVSPGPHVVDASEPLRTWSQRVSASPGVTTNVTVALTEKALIEKTPPPPTLAAPVLRPDSESSRVGATQRSFAYVIGGAGIAALGTGAALGIVALTKQSDIESACGGAPSACPARPGSLNQTVTQQQTFARLSDATFVGAGALLTTAVAVYLSAPHAKESRLLVTPDVNRTGASLGVTGRF